MFEKLISRPGRTISATKVPYMIIGDRFVRFAAVEDVIIHKIFAGRPRDMEDIRHIVIKNPSIDRAYIRKWLRKFDKSGEAKGFTDMFNQIIKKAAR